MSGLTDTVTMYLEMGLTLAVTAFMVLSVVLFIIDGIKSKRQHRKRKVGITIMFIISIILDVIMVVSMILIFGAIIMYIAGM